MGKLIWWGTGGMEFDRQPHGYEHSNGVITLRHAIVTNIIGLCAGGELALRSDGTVFNLGLMFDVPAGMISPFVTSVDVPAGLSNVVSIALEGDSYWAIKQDGTVKQWGNDTDDANIIARLSNINAVASAGFSNFLALRNDGTLLGFRLGAGLSNATVTEPAVRPVTVGGQVLTNVVALSSRGFNPLVLKRDGTVYALGFQTPGVLPAQPHYRREGSNYVVDLDGDLLQLPYQYTSADPVMADGKALSNVVAISSRLGHCLALQGDGTVLAFGDPLEEGMAVPAGLSNVVAIAIDDRVSLALKRDGTVVAWGDNSSGQTNVPPGLSNVVAIAVGEAFNGVAMALTTGNVPSSVHKEPHGRLELTAEISDLVFKGQVLSSAPAGNPGFLFQDMNLHETKMKVISILKGNPATNIIAFQHFTTPVRQGGDGPIGPPACFQFQTGETYLIFAASLDKGDFYYTPSTNINHRADQLRQIFGQNFPVDGVISTLDARPLDGLTIKEAYWLEMNLLLNGANPTNALHAINRLDYSSLVGSEDYPWDHSDVFKRADVLKVLLPFVKNTNEQVANRAITCFATDQVADILETNLDDPAFHVCAYCICWENIRHLLLSQPKENLAKSDMERYMDLLESALQSPHGNDQKEVQALYEFYRTTGLEQRAAAIRRKYAGDGPSFDEFDRQHPDLEPAVKH